ncbi:nuclear transport factor 2 family protein [Hymenobacter terrenus]|uniref:nuclear transport factor 2 family protein n=1 Tax=Hymenobacter terrenus TaxID=1629124 RepID=UPI0006194BE4|nr:nuclear transport factor 2 family protein [Hymenobacter terrenus]
MLLLFPFSLFALAALAQTSDVALAPTDPEQPAIQACISYYFQAGDHASAAELSAAFHPGALMFWVDDTGLMQHLTQTQWKAQLRATQVPTPATKRTIVLVDRTGDVAVARLTSEFSDRVYYDYMNLVKIAGRWQIVTKVFHRAGAPGGTQPVANLAADRQQIEQLLATKFRAMDTSDPDLLARAYHPRTQSYYTDENQLVAVSIGEWEARYAADRRAQTPAPTAVRTIRQIDCLGTVGYSRFTHTFPNGQVVTDYTLLLKIENQWRIVGLLITNNQGIGK